MKRSSYFLAAGLLCGALAWSQKKAPAPTAPAPAPGQSTPSSKPNTAPNGSPQPGAALTPRGPEAVAEQTPDKVVATIGGKQITAKQAADLLKPLGPEDRRRLESNLPNLVQQIYAQTQIAKEAEGMKLGEQSPWKEQLEIGRANILTKAYLAKMSEGGGGQDPKAYFDAHPADFDQIKLSGILVSFNQPGTPASSSTIQRAEPQARDKANDLEKKIKAGGDFSALARTDSDNTQSSARGGELGTFVMADQQLPPDVKNVIENMQAGQVSAPVRIQGGYYIFKIDDRTKLPFDQVRAKIVQKLQTEKSQQVLKQELAKYTVDVQDPAFFNISPTAPTPSLRVPSLQRRTPNASPATPPPGQPK